MLTIKNCQISLYYYFNKIMKEAGTSFQFPVQSQKHFRNVCLTAYQYLTKFLFQSAQNSKEISIRGNSTTSNVYNDVTDFKTCDFTKAKKSSYLKNEILFFLQIKKICITKSYIHLHPAHLASTQLSTTPSTFLEPKYLT